MIALYHAWDSLQSFKVRLCLSEIGIPWESRPIRLTDFEHLQPAYLKINPDGLVPCLVCETGTLAESSVINAFLDEACGQGRLQPSDAMARARMRWWCGHEDGVVHPAIRPPTFNLYIKPLLAALSTETLERKIASHPLPERAGAFRAAATAPFDRAAVIAALQTLDRTIGRMDAVLRQEEWLAGSAFSLADVAMSALVDRLEMLGLAALWNAYPNASRWAGAVAARPSFAEARGMPDVQMSAATNPVLCESLIDEATALKKYAKNNN